MIKTFKLSIASILVLVTLTSCGEQKSDADSIINKEDFENVQSSSVIIDNKITVFTPDGEEISFLFNDELVSSFKEYNELEYPLLAKIGNQNVYLFEDKSSGVILVKDNIAQYLVLSELGYVTPLGILPEIYYEDFDNDSEKELAINLYVGSGTDISVEELHIIEEKQIEDRSYFVINSYTSKNYIDDINKIMNYEINSNNDSVTLNLFNNEYLFDISEEVESIAFGNVSYFKIKDEHIKLIVPIGVVKKNMFSIQDGGIGSVIFDVEYKENKFKLSDGIISNDVDNPIVNKPILN